MKIKKIKKAILYFLILLTILLFGGLIITLESDLKAKNKMENQIHIPHE